MKRLQLRVIFISKKTRARKWLNTLSLTVALAASLQSAGRAQEAPTFLQTFDVSPGAPFGTPQDNNGMDASGRIISIVIDPTNDNTLYAASTFSGVWKSMDGGRAWFQASAGLRTGLTTMTNAPVLAVDALNPQRLLYATGGDDGRPGTPYGGLWVSTDAAKYWLHVDPCNKSSTIDSGFRNIYSVAFAFGQPFVSTDNCGIVTTTDPTLATGWTTIPGVTPFTNGASLATLNANPTLFACQGSNVYRTLSPLSSTPNWQTMTLPNSGACYGLMAAVQSGFELQPSSLLVIFDGHLTITTGYVVYRDVALVNFDAGTISSLKFSEASPPTCCGVAGVFVAPYRTQPPPGTPTGPLLGYDVYAEDGFSFFRFGLNGWQQLTGLHVDSWSMAFPSAYDPNYGNCTAYASNDGGLFVNPISGVGNCINGGAQTGWVLASSGLHVYASEAMAGLSQPSSACGNYPPYIMPCPILYDPAADDGVFASVSGVPESSWQDLGPQIGDAAQAFIDPALPTQVVSGRYGGGSCEIRLQTSNNAAPVIPSNIGSSICIDPGDFRGGVQTPRLGAFSEVMTLPTEAPLPFGDYLLVESPFINQNTDHKCPMAPASCDDVIARNLTAGLSGGPGIWQDISPIHFGPGWIGQIATAGGHSNTTVYVLTSNDPKVSPLGGGGFLWKGQIGSDGKIHLWSAASGSLPQGLVQGFNLIVNPYDPAELYVTDLGDGTIKTSRDGGQTWAGVQELKDIATNYGEFIFDCGMFSNGGNQGLIFQAACPLVDIAFNRNHPEIRVAALFPGGVAFSRDSGDHWLPLGVTNAQPFGKPLVYDLIEMPRSVFYDPQPSLFTGAPSIYVAVQGKGVKRVDGPFPTLMSGSIVFCPTCSNVPAGISVQIVAVVPALNATVLLRPGSDGLYRGNVLFDSAKLTVLDFYFEVGDQRTPTFTLQLTQDQIASGVALVTNAEPPVFSGAITACSDLTRRVRVYCVDVRLTETGEGAAQQVEITTINFETLEGTGSVTLARRPATNLPINLGNFADSNSRQVAVELNVPASVERFQMTVSGIAQDAIDRTSIFEFSQALNRDDLGSGISRQPAR